jgi:penicillin-binding protein 1C
VFEWLPAEAARDLPPCDVHVEVALDRRNGLRAGSGCPTEHVERRVFERYGPEIEGWARAASRPLAPEAWSPLCPPGPDDARPDDTADAGDAVRITYPHDGARFLLDPERPAELSAIPVLVAAPPSVRAVILRVDGVVVATLAPPFSTSWRLVAGQHAFQVEAAGHASAEAHITVR